jgi:hypothetical protein
MKYYRNHILIEQKKKVSINLNGNYIHLLNNPSPQIYALR